MKWLPIKGDVGVLVIRTPRSWSAPHRVSLQGHDRFYVRNSAGKHPMNVDELREAFTFGETLAERIRAFRLERVRAILADEGPYPVSPAVKLIFHIVPLSAFAPRHGIEPPLYAFVTLTNVKGIAACQSRDPIEDAVTYRRDLLTLPEFPVSAEQLHLLCYGLFSTRWRMLSAVLAPSVIVEMALIGINSGLMSRSNGVIEGEQLSPE
jgi:hypothetical protein